MNVNIIWTVADAEIVLSALRLRERMRGSSGDGYDRCKLIADHLEEAIAAAGLAEAEDEVTLGPTEFIPHAPEKVAGVRWQGKT
jgi:hypothetical protein